MTARPASTAPHPHEIAIVGTDVLLAARPARPVQVAHAVAACGYELVIPASWGDEILAEHIVREVMVPLRAPRVLCSCPRARQRLLARGSDLTPHLVNLVAPPVAVARYVRVLAGDQPVRITFLGACEGARDPAIQAQFTPDEFLRQLEERGIPLADQPSEFRDVIPPDRRRYWSSPGGAPVPDVARALGAHLALRAVHTADVVAAVAETLLSHEPVLLDVAPALGCACAGAGREADPSSRAAVEALEPPRALAPVIDSMASLDLRPCPGTLEPSPPPAPSGPESGARSSRRHFAVTPPGIAVAASRETPRRVPPRASERSARDAAPTPTRPAEPPAAPPPAAPTTKSSAPVVAPEPPTPPAAPPRPPVAARVARARLQSRVSPARGMALVRAQGARRGAPAASPDAATDAAADEAITTDVTASASESPAPSDGTSASAPVEDTPAAPAPASPVRPEPMVPPAAVDAAPARDAGTPIRVPLQAPVLRPVPPPAPAAPQRLWGLLASVIIIVALGFLLIAMMGASP